MQVREHYVTAVQTGAANEVYNSTSGAGARPTKTAVWLSKIDAEAPIGSNDDDYIAALDNFYDTKWKPFRDQNPTGSIDVSQVEDFLSNGTIPAGVDKNALRKIIAAGFSIQTSETAAQHEEKELNTTGALAGFQGQELQPQQGVDEVRTRTEETYQPADTRSGGVLPEGVYEPPLQQSAPRRSGEYNDNSAGWTSDQFYGVCECSKNVL